jgi:hypothetical protein
MTILSKLHRRLARLRRRRRWIRWGTGYSVLLTVLLWLLGTLFLTDWLLHMDVRARVVGMAISALCLIWVFRRHTLPWLGDGETEVDMAIFVQQQHHIDTDLVAALEFERPEASTWGSVQLEEQVIQQTAALTQDMDVTEGLKRDNLHRRQATLLITLAAAALAVGFFPDYARVFFNRLLLGRGHYPTQTALVALELNGHPIDLNAWQKPSLTSSYGKPVKFKVLVSGRIPEEGRVAVRIVSGGQESAVKLEKVNREASVAIEAVSPGGHAAAAAVSPGGHAAAAAVSPGGHAAAAAVSPGGHAGPVAAGTGGQASGSTQAGSKPVASAPSPLPSPGGRGGPGKAEDKQVVFTGELPRLVETVDYQVYLGDAWTDPAEVRVVPLPLVDVSLLVTPPSYAKDDPTVASGATGLRQIYVIEGSRVDVRISSDKQLREAAVTIGGVAFPMSRDSSPARDRKDHWRLDPRQPAMLPVSWGLWTAVAPPLDPVVDPTAYSIQVTDLDDLPLERPIEGAIRIKTDHPPTAAITKLVTLHVLPKAAPSMSYRATDDYGLSKVSVLAEVTHPDGRTETLEPVLLASLKPGETPKRLLQEDVRIDLAKLQAAPGDSSASPQAAGPVKLLKGDQVKLTLEAVDYRGPSREGKASQSDSVVLQVTDEEGIYEAMSETDRETARQYETMIERQLEVGGGP